MLHNYINGNTIIKHHCQHRSTIITKFPPKIELISGFLSRLSKITGGKNFGENLYQKQLCTDWTWLIHFFGLSTRKNLNNPKLNFNYPLWACSYFVSTYLYDNFSVILWSFHSLKKHGQVMSRLHNALYWNNVTWSEISTCICQMLFNEQT